MASNSIPLLLLACFLLASTQVHGSKQLDPKPTPVPTYSHSPPPVKAPAPPLPAVDPIATPPPYASPRPIVSPGVPTVPRTHLGYCVPRCQQKCKKHGIIRPCVKICTKCCEDNHRCVPLAGETCPNWTVTIYHGHRRSCPY